MVMTEKYLYFIWDSILFKNENLKTEAGNDITVIYPGTYNKNDGPDFKNARLVLKNQIIIGDVEIEIDSLNWFKHNHYLNDNFNNVKLIVVWHHNLNNSSKFDNIEILNLSKYFDESNLYKIKIRTDSLATGNSYCPFFKKKEHFIKKLDYYGKKRLNKKLLRFSYNYSKIQIFDELFYDGMLESLGYHKNKDNMLRIAIELPFRQLREMLVYFQESEYHYVLQAIFLFYFNLKDLLVIDSDYMLILENINKKLQRYINIKPVNIEWKLSKIRPYNHPIRRLVYFSYFLANNIKKGLTEVFVEAFYKDENILKNIYEVLKLSSYDNFWKFNWGWKKEKLYKEISLIGDNRIKTIVFNIILPLLYLFFEDKNSRNVIYNLLKNFPKLSNNSSQELVMQRYLKKNKNIDIKTALQQQGLLYIYETYCRYGNCSKCVISN